LPTPPSSPPQRGRGVASPYPPPPFGEGGEGDMRQLGGGGVGRGVREG